MTPILNWTATALAAVTLLGGCAGAIDRNVATQTSDTLAMRGAITPHLPVNAAKGSAAGLESAAREQLEPRVARRAERPWFGTKTVAVQSDEELPPIFYERTTLNFNDQGQRVPLTVVAERLYKLTNVPVRIAADVHQQQAGAAGQPLAPGMALPVPGMSANRPMPAPSPLPGANAAGADPTPRQSATAATTQQPVTDINAVDMNWKDRDLVTFLNVITDRLGLSWTYRDGAVTIQRYLTETFDLPVFSGTQGYSFNMSGSQQGSAGGGSGGSSGGASGNSASTINVTDSGNADIVNGLLGAVRSMLGKVPGATAMVVDGSSRLVVTTTKESMRDVRAFVKAEREALGRQVVIQFDVYSIAQNSSREAGVNLQAVFNNLQRTFGVTLTGPAPGVTGQVGGLGFNILSLTNGGDANSNLVRRWGDTGVMLQALHQEGTTVNHLPLTVVAMNRQWGRKTNLKQTGYVSETTPSTVSGAASGAPGLRTSTVTTGDRVMVQPAVLDDGTILLRFGVSLTTLVGLFDVSAGTGATFQQVQTPEVSGTDDQSVVRLRQGEVMVLSGMTRMKAASDGRALAEGVSPMLGGSRKASLIREDFIIFVRPVVL